MYRKALTSDSLSTHGFFWAKTSRHPLYYGPFRLLEASAPNIRNREAVRRCQARRGWSTALASGVANKGGLELEVSRGRGSLGVEGRVANGEQEGERYRRCHLGSATQPALPARKAVVLEARRRPGGACEESNRLSPRWKSMHASMTACPSTLRR